MKSDTQERCPSCDATDNRLYTDARGKQMRACGRCMIQWEAEPAASETDVERPKWTCFHCDFATSDPKQAAAHFGDQDESEPLCKTWIELDADRKASEYQSVLQELESTRDELAQLRAECDREADDLIARAIALSASGTPSIESVRQHAEAARKAGGK